MEVKEIVDFYVNEENNTLDVTFRLWIDGDDIIRTDQIDLNETDSFGLDITYPESYDDDEDDYMSSILKSYERDINLDGDEILSFLNEYYIVNPNNLPKPELF